MIRVYNKQVFSERKHTEDNIAPSTRNLYKDLKLKQTRTEAKTNILQKAQHILEAKGTSPDENKPVKCVTLTTTGAFDINKVLFKAFHRYISILDSTLERRTMWRPSFTKCHY